MATIPSSLSSALPRLLHLHLHRRSLFSLSIPARPTQNPRKFPRLILNCGASSFDDLGSLRKSSSKGSSKKSLLTNFIREIEPLDVGLIQKDVPPTTLDAMKRTISGMLGLLPSDQFHVSIEALWEPLSKLLVSSMMTGYTLRNAEYRLCLENNFDVHEEDFEKTKLEDSRVNMDGVSNDSADTRNSLEEDDLPIKIDEVKEESPECIGIEGLGEISPEAQQYILQLQSRLSCVKKELCEVKRKSAALQMQQFVGEEKNDLLDYLRSLQPEKVAELSEPASVELKETIHSVVHGLLATLSPRMHSKIPSISESTSGGTVNVGSENCTEFAESTSLQFQPLITLTRGYLARLLFWCMLLGHYLRGLEYRTELMELLSLTRDAGNGGAPGQEPLA